MANARLAEISLPDFGMSDAMPEIPADIYRDRLERLRARADEHGYDRLIVYADREHSANLAYLTGFDPRFEEAMLVVGMSGEPAILVGNECYGMAGAAPLEMRRHLFQDFSLPGQPRDRSRPLAEILADEGIREGSRVGVIGWKQYADPETIEVPAFIVDELRRMTPIGSVENAAHLLIGAGGRTPRDQRGGAARCVRVRGLPDLTRRPAAALRTHARHARGRRRQTARVERDAALVSPDAVERRAGIPRVAQPERPSDRARRPIHRRVRHLGCVELPRRVRRR